MLGEPYANTQNYWHSGYLGTCFQNFIDANKILEESELEESEKDKEIAAVLEARKFAFGDMYKYYPPWK